jgi:hypothetical protein
MPKSKLKNWNSTKFKYIELKKSSHSYFTHLLTLISLSLASEYNYETNEHPLPQPIPRRTPQILTKLVDNKKDAKTYTEVEQLIGPSLPFSWSLQPLAMLDKDDLQETK